METRCVQVSANLIKDCIFKIPFSDIKTVLLYN